MTSCELRKRLLFLLREAGPHRACELAEVIGVTTHEAVIELSSMRLMGLVDKFQVTAAIEKWIILRSPG